MRALAIILVLGGCSGAGSNGPAPSSEPEPRDEAARAEQAEPATEPATPAPSLEQPALEQPALEQPALDRPPLEEAELATLALEIDRDADPLHLDHTPAVHRLGMLGATGAIVALSRLDDGDELTRLRAERALEHAIFRDVRDEIARGAQLAIDPLRGLPAHLEARARSEAEAAVRAIGSIHDAPDRGIPIARARRWLEDRALSEVARGSFVTIAASRTLHERPGTPGLFVRFRISNDGHERVGVDLRRASEVPYLNQWGASSTPYRVVVDEERRVIPPLTQPEREGLLAAFRDGALTMLDPGASLDVYRLFDASTRSDVEAQEQGLPYLVLVLDGRLLATDGARVDDVRLGSTRELPALTPIRFAPLPARARVIE